MNIFLNRRENNTINPILNCNDPQIKKIHPSAKYYAKDRIVGSIRESKKKEKIHSLIAGR